MILLVILIFMVVTVNIYHSMRRSIRTRKEEIAMLVSLGAPVSHVQILFIGNGIMIGFLGSLLG
ncbi:ABC transporter permease, partial [Treponema pallidum]